MAVGRQQIVIYGGTFDPFHNGHLAVARYLRDNLNPDKVLVIPAGRPWLRDRRPTASPIARLEMCKLATAGEQGIAVSDIETHRRGNTYTIETVRELLANERNPIDIDLAVGSDSLTTLQQWHKVDELMRQCRLIVIQRPGSNDANMRDLPTNAVVSAGPNIDVDATAIREAYANSDFATAKKLVPPAVHRYIISEELYWCVPTK